MRVAPAVQYISKLRPVAGLNATTVVSPPALSKYASATFRAKSHDVLGPTEIPPPHEPIPARVAGAGEFLPVDGFF
jgi:hypothetical protein